MSPGALFLELGGPAIARGPPSEGPGGHECLLCTSLGQHLLCAECLTYVSLPVPPPSVAPCQQEDHTWLETRVQ